MAHAAQGGCGVSTLGDNQKLSDPGQPVLGGPAWAGGVGPDDLHRCLPTPAGGCDSVKKKPHL